MAAGPGRPAKPKKGSVLIPLTNGTGYRVSHFKSVSAVPADGHCAETLNINIVPVRVTSGNVSAH